MKKIFLIFLAILLCGCVSEHTVSCPAATDAPVASSVPTAPTAAPDEPEGADALAPPHLDVTTLEGDRIPALGGGFYWNMPQGDGTMRSAIADAAHPLQAEDMPVIETQEEMLALDFEGGKPDEVSVRAWPDKYLHGDFSEQFLTEIAQDEVLVKSCEQPPNISMDMGFLPEVLPGYVYEVNAKWNEDGEAWGNASYCFQIAGTSVCDIIIDQTAWAEAVEPFFSDEAYIYSFPGIYKENTFVYFTDGTRLNVVKALQRGKIEIQDLDRFGIQYYKEAIVYRG